MNHWKKSIRFAVFATALSVAGGAAGQHLLKIPNVRSGLTEFHQQGRLTVLTLKAANGRIERVALSHPSDCLQSFAAPYEATLITESQENFLIFTDSFASNPGNIQGQCGASPTGERFVHVVALGVLPHETLSVLMDSCLLDLEPTDPSPEWLAKPDSAGFAGRLILRFDTGPNRTVTYYVAPDGSVSRPEIVTNP